MRSFDAEPEPQGEDLPLVAIENVQMTVSIQLGRVVMSVGELLRMGRGSVITLDRKVGEPVDVLVNGKPIARGELVLNDGQLGVTLTEVMKLARGGIA